MLKKRLFLMGCLCLAIALMFSVGVWAQDDLIYDNNDEGTRLIFSGCTCMAVTPGASVDGSSITSHTDDSGTDRMRIWMEPAQDWEEGDVREIYWGRKHDDFRQIVSPMYVKGEIPQVPHTYAFLDTPYPFKNEKGLVIVETTIASQREVYNTEGWFEIGELMRIALERCTTAREAIELVTELAERYGFGGWAECFIFVDAEEIWFLEMFGPGPLWMGPDSGDLGCVWIAQRVPDGEVGVSANRSRIGAIDLDDPDHFMASENVFDLAIELGYWDPDSGKEFKVYETYGAGAFRGPAYHARREWRALDLIAPSLGLDPYEERYPFSVVPDKLVSVEDIMAINRDVYEGTQFDMTEGLDAGPFGIPTRWATSSQFYPEGSAGWERPISKFRANYSTVVSVRGDLPPWIGSLTWFGYETPHTTTYIPIYAGVTELPKSFNEGRRGADYDVLSQESAWWAFALVSNWAELRYDAMYEDIRELSGAFESQFLSMQPTIEKAALELYEKDPDLARNFLTTYTNASANQVVDAYWDLANMLIAKYINGYIYHGPPDYNMESPGYPGWWLEAVDFGESTIYPDK